MACVDLRALPLQLLLWHHRDWRECPVAVVDRDKPQGLVLWVNEVARASGILPGMRYAAALSLDADLRAGVVSDAEVGAGVDSLTRRLWRFSPCVEPSSATPGVFWLDASGILPLYRSYHEWAGCIRRDLAGAGFRSAVAVGFSRFYSYAAARAARGVVVFDSSAAEAARCRAVPIDRLDFGPRLRDTLGALGIEQLGQFLDLPAAGVHRRFGDEAANLHRRAHGSADIPLLPATPSIPLERKVIFDLPEADLGRIMAAIGGHLTLLIAALYRRGEVLADVSVHLVLDDGGRLCETLTPAEPTLDHRQIESLIRLRLDGMFRPSGPNRSPQAGRGVGELAVRVRGAAATSRQLDLFRMSTRDLAAGRRALARIRAEFGEQAVVRARLQEGHLPEARFVWERFERLEAPRPGDGIEEGRPLIRRYFPLPVALPLRSRHEPDGWVINLADGPIEEVIGPHVLSGGWWVHEVARDYYYVRTRSGRWLWIYNDRRRRRWYLHGEVE